VLASYFEYCIRRDTEDGRGPWKGRINPASGNPLTEELRHEMIGRDLPARQRQRDGFRRRIPRTLPTVVLCSFSSAHDSTPSARRKHPRTPFRGWEPQDLALPSVRVGRMDESQGKLSSSSVPFRREVIPTDGKDTVSRRKPAS
jgi:hypothetical protein